MRSVIQWFAKNLYGLAAVATILTLVVAVLIGRDVLAADLRAFLEWASPAWMPLAALAAIAVVVFAGLVLVRRLAAAAARAAEALYHRQVRAIRGLNEDRARNRGAARRH